MKISLKIRNFANLNEDSGFYRFEVIINKKQNNTVKALIIACVVSACALFASAASLEEARQLVVSGDYAAARKMAESLAGADRKVASTPLYNYIIGVCDFEGFSLTVNRSEELKPSRSAVAVSFSAPN